MKDFHIINPHHHAGYGAKCTIIEIVLTEIILEISADRKDAKQNIVAIKRQTELVVHF